MSASLLALLLALDLPAQADPVEIVAGQQYSAGQRIGVAHLGVSFVIPAGWGGGLPPGADGVVLGSDQLPGLIIVSSESGATVEEARAWMSSPQQLDALLLTPAGTPSVAGSRVSNRFQATDGFEQLSAAAAAVVGDSGTVLLAVAIGPTSHAEQQAQWVASIADSAQVRGPPPPPAGLVGALSGQYFSYSGSTTRWMDLCPDGRLRYRDESSYSGSFTDMGGNDLGGWGMASQGGMTGTWTATGAWQGGTITFRWDSGDSYTHDFRAVDPVCIQIRALTWCKQAQADCP